MIYLGKTPLNTADNDVKGSFVEIESEKFYKIANYNQMPDFFMTIVSDSDHWMYLSSNGSLTAGRKDKNNALFPYYTVDKIHDYCGKTGSKTLIIADIDGTNYLWEPFSKELADIYSINRNLYKSIYGNKIVFEEINNDLNLCFRYGWYNSEKFGWIKKSSIRNIGNKKKNVNVLDGLMNIIPNGVEYIFQNEYSNLSDAYKKNELITNTRLGIFSLSSVPVDKAEPSESLNATTVWSKGLNDSKILLSARQLNNFRNGNDIETEIDIRAARGAYFVNSDLKLKQNQSVDWMLVAEINQDTTDVANLNLLLKNTVDIQKQVNEDIKSGTDNLIRIVANADGLQHTKDELGTARHFSNTLFNVMRGGIYLNDYTIETADFKKFVATYNNSVYNQVEEYLNNLPEEINFNDLTKDTDFLKDSTLTNFKRICYEYLPLTFSRRHGDPSRPWNNFSIDIKDSDGNPKSDFQGNWRDIFQNWEALSLSYPEFVENIISKFLNATTADGYNPYRIMRKGIEWEAPDPDDPWAYIGYWGDHQIIYLQKLLELSEKYHPEKLDEWLTTKIFAFANVPYKIKGYTDIVKDPQNTIDFDFELNNKITKLVEEIGADGRLILKNDKTPVHVNLTEKILVTLLAKLSNFIPEAGIWLNTQRPEWNDANNALVGSGVSMVTLYYIRRFMNFWLNKFEQTSVKEVELSEEVNNLFSAIFGLFDKNRAILKKGFKPEERKHFADVLGKAGEKYRNSIYENSFSGKRVVVKVDELKQFMAVAIEYTNQSIDKNKREDGLYHSYNLISFKNNGISIRYLYEMLEGQVALLSAGYLKPNQSLDVLDALKASALFREDQYSYILYPDRNLPRFNKKNNIPAKRVEESELLKKLVENKDTAIIKTDTDGNYHFNGEFRNAKVLKTAIEKLDKSKYGELALKDKNLILDIYEEMFDHQSFTGRSGTFFAFEGLGSIYWHMVSKLLLAVEENFIMAVENNASDEIIGKLMEHYYEIKAGIGIYKSPQLYGAFPTDAYSHTPAHSGAKQPGMTGQVKEDVITRMGELGVRVANGKISFELNLINKNEFTENKSVFEYIDIEGTKKTIELDAGQIAYTICQVPVVYTGKNTNTIVVTFSSGQTKRIEGNTIDKEICRKIFKRTNEINLIELK